MNTPPTPCRVLLAVCTRLYASALRHALATGSGEFSVEATLLQDEDPIAWLDRVDVDVILIDMARPRARELLSELAAHAPDVALVAFGIDDDEAEIVTCAEAGMSAYVPRDADEQALRQILQSAARGEFVCSPKVAGRLLARLRGTSRRGADEPSIVERLTAREREILRLVEEGASNREIAVELCLSLSTVKGHMHRIFQKVDARSRSEAVARVRRLPSVRVRSAGF